MFKFEIDASAEQRPTAWIPAVVMLLAIVPVVASSKQPIEITATIFSAYVAIIAVVGTVIAKKKGKRSLAIIATAAAIAFTALFSTYSGIAFGR